MCRVLIILYSKSRKFINNSWHQNCSRCSPVSHLFFVDDSLMFCKAIIVETANLKNILSVYESLSGQKINYDKSEISFNRNMPSRMQQTLQRRLNVKAVEKQDKYLCIPTHHREVEKVGIFINQRLSNSKTQRMEIQDFVSSWIINTHKIGKSVNPYVYYELFLTSKIFL